MDYYYPIDSLSVYWLYVAPLQLQTAWVWSIHIVCLECASIVYFVSACLICAMLFVYVQIVFCEFFEAILECAQIYVTESMLGAIMLKMPSYPKNETFTSGVESTVDLVGSKVCYQPNSHRICLAYLYVLSIAPSDTELHLISHHALISQLGDHHCVSSFKWILKYRRADISAAGVN